MAVNEVPDENFQCRAHYQADVLVRCFLQNGRGIVHDGQHFDGNFCWAESLAIYPGELNKAGLEVASGSFVLGPGESTGGAHENQVGGDHYRAMKIQPWDIVDAHGLDYYRGNVLKYLLRAGRKGPAVEDLKKALHYLEKAIEREEEKSGVLRPEA